VVDSSPGITAEENVDLHFFFDRVLTFIIPFWYTNQDKDIHNFMAVLKTNHLVQNLYGIISSKVKVSFNIESHRITTLYRIFSINESDLFSSKNVWRGVCWNEETITLFVNQQYFCCLNYNV
jgi:hypothetical protein